MPSKVRIGHIDSGAVVSLSWLRPEDVMFMPMVTTMCRARNTAGRTRRFTLENGAIGSFATLHGFFLANINETLTMLFHQCKTTCALGLWRHLTKRFMAVSKC